MIPGDDDLGVADGTAFGCGMRVVVTRWSALPGALAAVEPVLRAIDESCSRFRDDSDLSLVNARPETRVRVGRLLVRALDAALRAAERTGGAVDPTLGRPVRTAGYDRDLPLLPADGGPVHLVRPAEASWRRVRLDRRRRSVWIPAGVELDLGATAKALAADLAADAAAAAVGGGVLVSLGGDVAARGEAPPGGWRVQVGDDSRAVAMPLAETVTILDGGLATSSNVVRRGRRGGVTLHHIIDPCTGAPADGPWRTATVAAGTCVDANTAATAAIMMGADAAEWLADHGLPARLVDREGTVTRVGAWPAPARDLAS